MNAEIWFVVGVLVVWLAWLTYWVSGIDAAQEGMADVVTKLAKSHEERKQ